MCRCSKSSFKENSDTYSKLYDQAIRLFNTKKPIISIIQGAAVGGGLGLALVSDFRIGSRESKFSANFSKLGFHQGFGITVTLPKIIGKQNAKMLLLTGRRIKGEEAFKIGLLDYLMDQENLMQKAIDFSFEINSSGPLGVQSIRNTLDRELYKEVETILKIEYSEQVKLKDTEDFKEGIKASLERREPNFKNL